MHTWNNKKEWIVLSLIFLVAIFFRFCQLDITPPGLWPDEAANGVDALKAIENRDFDIFYPANNGREGLFINLQAISIGFLGATPFALRLVSAIIGTLTVLGLYFLTRELFNWRVAAIASFFLAISSWHVIFSRIGFRAIMLPFILVWAFYFLWRGLKNGHLKEFFIAGLIGGLGFYTYFSFRIAPLIVLILFWNYWSHLATHFSHSKYEYARNQLLRGFAVLATTVIVIGLPLLVYFYTHPEDFLKREGRPISVFAQEEPFKELILSTMKTLDMFNFSGDWNLRHNIPGSPQLALPIGLLFIVGFFRELNHWLRKKSGHFSTTHTFLFSWFFVMLLPGFLSTEAPHALRTIGVIPVVMIFSAQGFWWLIGLVYRWQNITDVHAQTNQKIYKTESRLLIASTILIFLISLMALEYHRYFKKWATDPGLKDAFSQKLLDIADYLNKNPDLTKFVLVNEGDVLVDGVPNNAQTIKFLTRTHSQTCSSQKKIYYLNVNQISTFHFPPKYLLIPMADNEKVRNQLFWEKGLYPKDQGSFVVYE